MFSPMLLNWQFLLTLNGFSIVVFINSSLKGKDQMLIGEMIEVGLRGNTREDDRNGIGEKGRIKEVENRI